MKKISILLSLCFLGVSTFAQNIANFENWRNYTVLTKALTIPQGWNASDSLLISFGVLLNPTGTFVAQVSKETPGRNGSDNAMKVMTRNQAAITGFLPAGPAPCMATNGKMNVNQTNLTFDFSGGITHVGVPVSASFWVKNNPLSGDTTEVTILAIDNSDGGDSIVAVVDTMLGATISNFTQISMPFTVVNNSFTPNILRVIVSSSGNAQVDSVVGFTNTHDGSYIIVDDIEITAPAGVINLSQQKAVADVYPTLSKESVHVRMKESGNYTFRLLDAKGSILHEVRLTQAEEVISLAPYANGVYYYSLSNEQRQILQTGKLMKQD